MKGGEWRDVGRAREGERDGERSRERGGGLRVEIESQTGRGRERMRRGRKGRGIKKMRNKIDEGRGDRETWGSQRVWRIKEEDGEER